LAVFVNLDVNYVGTAADGAILYVFLGDARRPIDRDHDLIAARITDIIRFVVHGGLLGAAGNNALHEAGIHNSLRTF